MARFFLTFLLALCFSCAHAQWHIGLDAGYGLPWSIRRIGDASFDVTGSVPTKSVFATSFGQGVQYGATVSYAKKKYVEVELGLSYLSGKFTEVTDKDFTESTVEDYTTEMFRVTPSLKLKAGQKKLMVFGRLGLGLGFGGSISYQPQRLVNSGRVISSTTWVYSGGTMRHLVAGLGLERSVGKTSRYRFFSEIRLFSGVYSPNKGEMTKSEQNGQDRLSALSVREKHIVFQSSIKAPRVAPDPNQAEILLRWRLPFSSVGLNIGVAYKL